MEKQQNIQNEKKTDHPKSVILQELEVLEKFLMESPENEILETASYIFERVKINIKKIENSKEKYLVKRFGAVVERIKKYLGTQPEPEPLLPMVKDAIDRAKIVSFDIFDTLLVRPYVKPTDLFYHIEYAANAPGFAVNRINAENNARYALLNTENEDVAFGDIYKYIDGKFAYLKETELRMEQQILRINPEIKQIYDYAKNKDKRIIIISDMYLPLDFIKNVLMKNGITGYEKIYLSGEHKKTKGSSRLYQLMLEELKISPECIFHIGDNKGADYDSALHSGMNAFHYTQLIQQYYSQNPKIRNFYSKTQSTLAASIFISVQAYKWKLCSLGIDLPNYWEKLGYYISGVIAFAFCKFIKRQSDKLNIDKILFCARDGYVLQKVFDFMYNKSGIETDYIYASRIASWCCNLVYDDDPGYDISAKIKLIIDYYKQQSAEFAEKCEKNQISQTMPEEFIEQQKEVLSGLSEKTKEKYRNYFNQKTCGFNNIAIVDVCSRSFTSQRFVDNYIDENLTGFYIYADKKTRYYNENKIVSWGDMFPLWDLWEFILSSHEPPVYDITQEFDPIYIQWNEANSVHEKFRNAVYPFVEKGAVELVEDLCSLFGNDDFPIEFELIIFWFLSYFENLCTEDAENLSKLYHAKDHLNNCEYKPLFRF